MYHEPQTSPNLEPQTSPPLNPGPWPLPMQDACRDLHRYCQQVGGIIDTVQQRR